MEQVSKLPTLEGVTKSIAAFSLLCIEHYYDHIMDFAKNKSTIQTLINGQHELVEPRQTKFGSNVVLVDSEKFGSRRWRTEK
jgi:predicted secreted acid phosphatase